MREKNVLSIFHGDGGPSNEMEWASPASRENSHKEQRNIVEIGRGRRSNSEQALQSKTHTRRLRQIHSQFHSISTHKFVTTGGRRKQTDMKIPIFTGNMISHNFHLCARMLPSLFVQLCRVIFILAPSSLF